MPNESAAIMEQIKRVKEAIFLCFAVVIALGTLVCAESRMPDYLPVIGFMASTGLVVAAVARRVRRGGPDG